MTHSAINLKNLTGVGNIMLFSGIKQVCLNALGLSIPDLSSM